MFEKLSSQALETVYQRTIFTTNSYITKASLQYSSDISLSKKDLGSLKAIEEKM